MTAMAEVSTTARTVRWLSLNSDRVIKIGGLLFVAVAGFAGAFTHMHDWTARYELRDWMCWVNAIISEIMPTVSFLVWRDREEQERPTFMPIVVFLGSTGVSVCAQLSSTGKHFPHEREFLACLPLIALMALAKLVLGDLKYAKEVRIQAEKDAADAAELARKQQVAEAELAAERDAELKRRDAELAAELSRREVELAAELDRERREAETAERLRLAEIEAAAITERERLAAQERAEVRRIEGLARDREVAAEQRRKDEAARIEAQARADRERAQAALLAAEAERAAEAARLLAAQSRPVSRAATTDGGEVRALRQRRPRAETEAIAAAALAGLPEDTSRDDAVRAVARALDSTERYAREFVPAGWPAVGSAGGEESQAA